MSSSKFVGQLKQNNIQISNLKESNAQTEKHMVDHENRLTKLVDEFIEDQNYELKNHTENKNNPHSVTKEQIGLSNVSNNLQATKIEFDQHIENIANPHQVTKSQVGLGNVENVKQETPLGAQEKANTALKDAKLYTDIHANRTDNPHQVTKDQLGLANVSNDLQATKSEFDLHTGNNNIHITAAERSAWLLKSNLSNSVTSGDTTKALNCEGAKILNDKITELQTETYLTDVISVTSGEVILKDDITKYKKLLITTGAVSTRDLRTSLVRSFYNNTFRPGADIINAATSRGKIVASVTTPTSLNITQADDALRYIIGLKY
ncbi:hypothetical protein [Bacillus subtilis]|uniref:Uncharacterized protein n=1 Tax=Bacillus subtilis subsp. subtilis TaxID=135461 RepID=A0ABD3ZV00_BACIU|nr:hypothetical protein [Bacillus subtilis]KIL31999.1 hypothetical protein B4067_2272 [Bacillus subtilis subsp. subtilis]KIN58115.1 hypothetical protein B4145_2187 [Bacillus subtilis]